MARRVHFADILAAMTPEERALMEWAREDTERDMERRRIRTEQRQRITAAKRRARLVTRTKAAKKAV